MTRSVSGSRTTEEATADLQRQLEELEAQGEEEYDIQALHAEANAAKTRKAIAVSKASRVRTTSGANRARALGLPPNAVPDCGATTRGGNVCRLKAGHGTDHYGLGTCKYHGGKGATANTKHGRYANLLPVELATVVEHFAHDVDPLNLEPDIALMRGLVERWISDYDDWYEIVSAWHESFQVGDIAGRPQKISDITDGHKILESLSKMVEREYKRRQNTAVSQIHLFRIINAIGEIISKHVTDKDTLKVIREEMLSIRLPGKVG